MIRGFLFDFDGTLVDSERESAEAMARVLERDHGIAVEAYDRDFVIGRSWMAIYDNLKTRYPQLAWPRDELIARTAAEREHVIAEMGVTILPGAQGLLAWTRGRGPRAVVTGSSRVEVHQLIPLLGPDAVFDAVIASEDVPRSKPHPDGYQAAMAAIRLPARDCLVVEDSVNGIAAGKAAGCLVVAVRAGNFGGWDQSAAHHVVDTLDELTPSLVDQLARDYGFGMGPR